MSKPIPLAGFLAASLSIPALAQEPPGLTDDSAIFGFAGRHTTEYIEYSLIPFLADYEDTFVLGGGYQKFLLEPLPDVRLGVEVGLAARIGEEVTGEIWGGGVARYDGFRLGEDWRVSPSLSFGLSAVSGSTGAEAAREVMNGGNAHVLFYLAPEVSFSHEAMQNTEIFFRIHHRSGAWGALGNMGSGHNAQVVGIRHHF